MAISRSSTGPTRPRKIRSMGPGAHAAFRALGRLSVRIRLSALVSKRRPSRQVWIRCSAPSVYIRTQFAGGFTGIRRMIIPKAIHPESASSPPEACRECLSPHCSSSALGQCGGICSPGIRCLGLQCSSCLVPWWAGVEVPTLFYHQPPKRLDLAPGNHTDIKKQNATCMAQPSFVRR